MAQDRMEKPPYKSLRDHRMEQLEEAQRFHNERKNLRALQQRQDRFNNRDIFDQEEDDSE